MIHETPTDKPIKIFLAVVLSQALFSIMNAFVKLALGTHPIIQVMFFRSAIALIAISLLILHEERKAGVKPFTLFKTANPMAHFWRSSTGVAAMLCYFTAFATLPLANVTAIGFAAPLILTLLSIPMLGEKVGIHRLGAVAVGLGSVIFIFAPEIEADRANLWGNMAALGAAVLTAFSLALIRKMGRTENHLTIVFYFTLACTLVSAIALPFFWVLPSAQSLFFLLMVGLCGGSAQIFITWSYAHAPAAYASAFFYTAIIFATTLDWYVWGHVIDPATALGSVIIVASGLYVLYREARKKRAPLLVEPPVQD